MDCFSVFEDGVCIFKVTPRSKCMIGLALTIFGEGTYPFSYQIGADWEDAKGVSNSIVWIKKKLSLATKLQIRRERTNEEIWPNCDLQAELNHSEEAARCQLLAKVKIGSEKERLFPLDCPSHFIVSFGESMEAKSSTEYHLSFFGRKSRQENLTYFLNEDLSEDQIEIILLDVPLNEEKRTGMSDAQ